MAQERVTELLRLADEAKKTNDLPKAASILKEASQVDPESDAVKSAWLALQSQNGGDASILSLVKAYLGSGKEEDGRKALRGIQETVPSSLPSTQAAEAVDLLLSADKKLASLDELTASLLGKQTEARRHMAKKLATNATNAFMQLLAQGDRTFAYAQAIVLEDALWSLPDTQESAQQDVFRLCIATLMEAGVDQHAALMKAIARQLAVKPGNVASLIDEDVADVVLSNLDIRLGMDIRSQAMVATAKLLEASDHGEHLFATFVASHAAKQTNDDLIVAFSAAAAVFPILPAVAAKLFMTDGFVQQLVPNLERNSDAAAAGKR
jgi:protein unc-45